MKFSKTAWIALGIGVIIIAAAFLVYLYFQETNQQNSINKELGPKKDQLATLTSERDSLESRLEEIESTIAQEIAKIEAAQSEFPISVESIEVDELLFNVITTHDLVVTSIQSSTPVEMDEEGILFLITPFIIQIEGRMIEEETGFATAESYRAYVDGTVDDIVACLNGILQHTNFKTAFVSDVNVVIPEPVTDEEVEGKGADIERPSLTINMSIYSIQGGVNNNG